MLAGKTTLSRAEKLSSMKAWFIVEEFSGISGRYLTTNFAKIPIYFVLFVK
jgi:hypothetical protein